MMGSACVPALVTALSGLAQAPPLTLDEALRLAQQNAFALKIAEAATRQAEARLREAEGNRGVQVRVNAAYTRFDREIVSGSGSNSFVVRPIDQKSANVAVSYPIDTGGLLGRAVIAARYLVLASEDSFRAELNTLKLIVRQSFFQVLQAEEQVAVFEEALKVSTERQRVLEAQLAQGAIARVDVLRGETQMAQNRSDLLRAQNGLELAKNALNNAIGRAIEIPFDAQPVGGLPTVGKGDQELAETAMKNRPEVQSLLHQASSFEQARLAAKAGLAPNLNLSLTHAREFGSQGFASSEQSTTAVLGVSFALYDSGITSSKVAQAREQENQLRLRAQQAELAISLEVRQALASMRTARARLDVAERAVATAAENLRLAILRTDNGEGIQLEVVDAQNQLTLARSQRVAANYDYLTAFAQLQRAVGSDDLSILASSKEGR